MTLSTGTSLHDEKKLVEEREFHKLTTSKTIYVILISCFAMLTAIMISIIYGPTIFTVSQSPLPSPSYVDLGSANGFVMSADGLPVGGATVQVYKHMALPSSADKNSGYSTSVLTGADGAYELSDLPSGVYRMTMTDPDGAIIRSIDNYAVWPGSSSSYIFTELE
jgi:hypothetical protein